MNHVLFVEARRMRPPCFNSSFILFLLLGVYGGGLAYLPTLFILSRLLVILEGARLLLVGLAADKGAQCLHVSALYGISKRPVRLVSVAREPGCVTRGLLFHQPKLLLIDDHPLCPRAHDCFSHVLLGEHLAV